MTQHPRRVVVVGAGLGGLMTCEALRSRGYAGELVLVGEEARAPYDRPPLSKDVLRGEPGPVPLRSAEDVAALELDLRLGTRALALRPGALELSDGSALPFDYCVLAVGARPHQLPGSDGARGVHVLRTHEDATALAADVAAAGRLVVVGGGYLGCEAALAARAAGREVLLLEAFAGPLMQLGPQVAARVRGLLDDAGVDVRGSAAVSRVLGAGGRVTGLLLAGGEQVPAPVVLAALGVAPDTAWLTGLERDPDGGVRCSPVGRTSLPQVSAVGDAASWDGRREEHWTSAVDQAGVVAADLLGQDPPARSVPYVWSTLWTAGGPRTLQVLGAVRAGTETEVTATPAGLVALHAEPGTGALTGVVALDAPRVVGKARRLLRAGVSLADARTQLTP